ncbi:MAG: ABC transporter permease [Anaerolineales bacterium]|nr:ABC transporter permease [Anaerolineales bacterium]
MNWARRILALVGKDIKLYFKNRFFALITVLALVFYTGVYFLMPAQVDETIEIGWVAPELPGTFFEAFEDEGLVIARFEDQAGLEQAIQGGDLQVGYVLGETFLQDLEPGAKPEVNLLYSTSLPEELRDVYPLLIEEMVFALQGEGLSLEVSENIIGTDLAGNQIPPRDRMLPLLTVFVLMMETLGLASLITTEIAWGTIKALLVTPLNVTSLFLGKGITGVTLAFGQALLLILITGGLVNQPLLIITALFLGAVMVSGIAFLIASVSKDMMSVIGWGTLAILLLAIPSINILIPGMATEWIRILPSYYLVEIIHQAVNFDSGWQALAPMFLGLSVFTLFFVSSGVFVLRRRFQ